MVRLETVLVILMAASGCSGPAASAGLPTSAATQLSENTLRLVTWNIQKCEGGLERVIGQLAALTPDVVFLQEAIEPPVGSRGENQTRRIAQALIMQSFSDGARLDGSRNQCIAIPSRAAMDQTERLMIANERSYGITAMVSWNGRPLRLVCVHLAGTWKVEAAHIAATFAERQREWKDLLRRAARWSGATIVAGDFNTPTALNPIARLNERLPRVADLGATFPSASPALELDHVFQSAELKVKAAEAVACPVSDHRPVLVEFRSAATK